MMMIMILMMMMMKMTMLVYHDDDDDDDDDEDDDDDGNEYIGNFVDISCKVAKFESFQHSSKLSALLLAFLTKVEPFFQNFTFFSERGSIS